MALTSRKRLFAEAKIQGKSNKDAACEAGYSEKTASAAGSRLVKDADVKSYIAAHKKIKGKPANKSGAAEQAAAQQPESRQGFVQTDLDKILLYSDPKDFLLAVMNDQETERKLRVEAAKGLMPFMHARLGEGGKKEAAADAAKKAANKFAPTAPPRLKAVK
jgi:phage terminase small subunit